MLRRIVSKATPLASKSIASVSARAFSHHVDVPKNLKEGFPFQVLPYQIGKGEKKIVIGPMTGVDAELYPIEENPDKNPAIAFILTEDGAVTQGVRSHERTGIMLLFGTMLAIGALELYTLGGFHEVPQEVYDNYAVLDKRDQLYASQFEKSWSELRAEDYA